MIPRHRIGSAFVRAGISLLASCLLLPSPADAGQDEQATDGRVVATITTLEGSVQMSGVAVELRESGGKLAIAKTLTDGVGQVTFPDVPPGQYVIIASRPGFIERQSAAFTVKRSRHRVCPARHAAGVRAACRWKCGPTRRRPPTACSRCR